MADGTYVDGGETENLSAGSQFPVWLRSDIPKRMNYGQL
jgi:hypothetical protein